MSQSGAAELDEFADHPLLPQHLGDGQHQVGGRHPFAQFALQPEADHLGEQHRDRLAEHGRFGLDPPHPPAEHAEAVDHGGVAVGADQGVGIGEKAPVGLGAPDGSGQILEVDLMADAGPRRDHAKVFEGGLPPAQKRVALAVALHFDAHVLGKGRRRAIAVDLHRVVDDQVDGNQRVDPLRVGPLPRHGVAHGGQIDHGRHPGEILHQHPRRAKGDLPLRGALLQPGGNRFEVLAGDRPAIREAQQVLQQDLHRERQAGEIPQMLVSGGKTEVIVGFAAGLQGAAGVQAVVSEFAHRVVLQVSIIAVGRDGPSTLVPFGDSGWTLIIIGPDGDASRHPRYLSSQYRGNAQVRRGGGLAP